MSIRRGALRRVASDDGYTLIEFAVAMGVFLAFMSLATPFMFSQLRSARQTEENVLVQQAARGALRTMTRDLRQARVLYQSEGQPSGSDVISIGIDFDGNGTVVAGAGETVTYYRAAGDLYRGRTSTDGQPLAEGISALTFEMFGSNPAFDANGDGTVSGSELNGDGAWTAAELANVTRVRVSLTAGTADGAQTYAADAWLRNRVVG